MKWDFSESSSLSTCLLFESSDPGHMPVSWLKWHPLILSLTFQCLPHIYVNLMARAEWGSLMNQPAGHVRRSHIPKETVQGVISDSNPWTPMFVSGSTSSLSQHHTPDAHLLPWCTPTLVADSAGSSTWWGECGWVRSRNWGFWPPENTSPTEWGWEVEAASCLFPHSAPLSASRFILSFGWWFDMYILLNGVPGPEAIKHDHICVFS